MRYVVSNSVPAQSGITYSRNDVSVSPCVLGHGSCELRAYGQLLAARTCSTLARLAEQKLAKNVYLPIVVSMVVSAH